MSKTKTEAPQPDFQDRIIANLRKHAPRSEDAGIYEVTRTSEEVLSKIQYVLKTGNPAFDDLVGGMPFGRIVEVYGLESCGKTALAIRCAARARHKFISEVIRDKDGGVSYRQLDPDQINVGVVYIDNERSLDDDRKLVVDGDRLDVGAGYCDTIDKLFLQIDSAVEAVENEEKHDRDRLHFLVIVVDTIASTSSRQELAQPWGKVDYSRAPQQYSQGFRKIISRLNTCNVCLICTNQVRTNFKVSQDAQRTGRPLSGASAFEYTSYGGYALRFYATHRVFLHALTSRYKLVPTAKFPAGINIGFESVKNRIRMPMRNGRMVLLLDPLRGGLDAVFSMLETLVYLGGIEVKAREKMAHFVCNFDGFGVAPATFEPSETDTTLEQDDQRPRRGRQRRELGFRYRADWPAFYARHQADCDALWTAVVNSAFTTQGLDGEVREDEQSEEIEINPAMPQLEDN
jgi:recombination protein RecA